MKKIKSYLYLFVALIIMLGACNSEMETQLRLKSAELDQFKLKVKQDSTLLENYTFQLEQINSTLDSVNGIEQMLKDVGKINKTDALAKITLIDSLLNDRSKKVQALSAEVSKLQSGSARKMAMARVTEGVNEITIKQNYYKELREKISNLKTENIQLKDLIEAKDRELQVKDKTLKKERTEKQGLQSEIQRIMSKYEQDKKGVAQSYYQLAMDLKTVADNIKDGVEYDVQRKPRALWSGHGNLFYAHSRLRTGIGCEQEEAGRFTVRAAFKA